MDEKELLKYFQHGQTSNPIGQGKNLDALLKLRESLGKAPGSVWEPNFQMIGDAYDPRTAFETVGEAYDPRAKDLVTRGTTEAAKFGDEAIETTAKVLNKGPKGLFTSAVDAGADVLGPLLSKASKVAAPIGRALASPYTTAAVTALEPSELGSNDSEMIRLNREQKALSNMDDPSNLLGDIASLGQEEDNMSRGFPAGGMSIGEPAKPEVKQIQELLANSDSPVLQNISKNKDALRMIEALMADNQSGFSNTLLRAAIQIGSAIGGVDPDYSGVDALDKSPKSAAQLKEILSSEDRQRTKDQEALFDDPNSEISKKIRERLTSMGYGVGEGVSASTLQKAGVNLNTILGLEENKKAREEAAESRKAIKEMEMLKKQDLADSKKIEKNDDFIFDAQNKLAKPFQDYQKVRRNFEGANRVVEQIKNGTITPGSGDVQLLYSYIKSFDPTSVVREGEIALGRKAEALFNRFGVNVKNITGGDLLSQDFRKSITKIANNMLLDREKEYKELAQPYLNLAKKRGIEDDRIKSELDFGGVLNEQKEPTKQDQVDLGGSVRIRNRGTGKMYVVPVEKYKEIKDKSKYEVL